MCVFGGLVVRTTARVFSSNNRNKQTEEREGELFLLCSPDLLETVFTSLLQ